VTVGLHELSDASVEQAGMMPWHVEHDGTSVLSPKVGGLAVCAYDCTATTGGC
jgi:hypothetical protein